MRYVRRLDRPLVVEATRHTREIWGEGRSQAAHTKNVLEQLGRAGPDLLRYVGLVERGRLVASIKRYSLLLRVGAGSERRAVGIGAVFTPPSSRGQGFARDLVRAVMEEARELGYAAAVLYSDIDPSYYARLGFVPLPARDFEVRVKALPTRGALDVRPARAADLDAMLAFHEAALQDAHPSWLVPLRSRALFQFFRWRNGARAWILSTRGRDVGALLAGPDDPSRDLPHAREPGLYWFDEASAPGITPERVWATVRALAEKARARVVRGWLGPDGMPDGARAERRAAAWGMIAPLTSQLTIRPRRTWLDSFGHF